MRRDLAATLVRGVARTDVGRATGQHAYRAAARATAAWLGRIDGVDGVYLTGSATRRERIDPGWSDIDPVLVTELPDVDAELRMRATLLRRMRTLRAIVPAVHQADYIERRDLPLLRRWPNAWTMGFDERWEHLAGADRRTPPSPPIPTRQRRLEQLRRSLRRWCKATVVLRDPARPDARRNARRLLADVAAAWLDADRLSPWPELAARAGHPDAERAGALEVLAMALDVLERFAREVAQHRLGSSDASSTPSRSEGRSGGPWRVRGELPPAPDVSAVERAAQAAGLGPVLVASRDPRSTDRVVICRCRHDDGPADAVARMTAVARAASVAGGWVRHPILITEALWSIGWLIDVPPFAAASLALAGGEAPPAPTDDDLHALLPVLLVERLIRARGRRLRLRPGGDLHRATWREIASLAPGLEAIRRGEPVHFSIAPDQLPDERALLQATRDLSHGLHEDLAP